LTAEETFINFIEGFRGELGEIKYEKTISEMAIKGEVSLIVDFNDLYEFDDDFASEMLILPLNHLSTFDIAILSKLRMRDPEYAKQIKRLHVRLKGLPMETPLRSIGAEHIGRLIMVYGIIVRATSVQPLLLVASFKCPSCGERIVVEQDEQTIQKPQKCPTCDNRKGFKLITTESEFIDSQKIIIQERPEDLPPGQLPRSIQVELKDDLVDIARPGDRITLTGLITLLPRYGRGGELRTFDIQVDASYTEISGREMELLEISHEDEEAILEVANDPRVFQNLLGSIAPSIYGYEHIKESILYLLFGGVPKYLPDMRIRGDINVLLVGDPGTAKSQMLQYASRVSPRGLFTTGRGSTAAGLTAAVVKEGGTGSFVLEAGALVLADKGVCCIDEFEKMRDEDRGAIHPAMEQQVVSIAKGGIVATLNARTSILAAANPTLGRYNPYQNIAQNLGTLSTPLLSRFDLIFVIKDLPETDTDTCIAEHIIDLHMAGGTPVSAHISKEMLRKYISYAKQINPKITEEVKKTFIDFYIKMRRSSIDDRGEVAAISITARQLESLVRIAEARARAHLRNEVTAEDAEAATAIMHQSLEQVGIDMETGQIDIDILYSGKPRSLQSKLQKVLNVISEMERISGSVRDDDLYATLQSDHSINQAEASRLIGVLMKDGTIYLPRPKFYKRNF